VRHPYYLANFLVDCCFCLLSGSRYMVLIYLFLFFWAYGPTMRKEERTLFETYGSTFSDYILETPRLFPDRQSLRNIGSLFEGFLIKRVSAKELARILRFWAMATVILCAGQLAEAGFFRTGFFQRPLSEILLALAIILYIVSGVILWWGKRRANGKESLSS
jgi:protein-S-isoprenylcysteine O-methyltransferase Ste14